MKNCSFRLNAIESHAQAVIARKPERLTQQSFGSVLRYISDHSKNRFPKIATSGYRPPRNDTVGATLAVARGSAVEVRRYLHTPQLFTIH